MTDKYKVTILYDGAEDEEKAKADAKKEAFPLVYEQVSQALEKRGHQVKSIAAGKNIKTLVGRIDTDESDIFFNLCESIGGVGRHEHRVASLLELLNKPFTGSGSTGMTLAQDKGLAKKIFQFHDIRYPRFCVVDSGHVEWSDDLSFPLIVKPLGEDASIGIDKGSVVHDVKELLERISHLRGTVQGAALVEEFIEGREIYVGVVGNAEGKLEPLPILEWDLSAVKDGPRIATAEAKWDQDSEGFKAPQLFPKDIPDEVVKRIGAAAVTAVEALKLTDYARVDMRLRKNTSGADKSDAWQFFIIEVNPNPYLERRAEFVQAARKHGLSHPELLERILELGVQRAETPVLR